jgi:hypothetical protein
MKREKTRKIRGIAAPACCCLLGGLTLCAAGGGPRPAAKILLGEVVAASGDRAGVPHVEPSLAAHPTDPDLLFGAAVTYPDADPSRGGDSTIVDGFRSTDGGRSWSRVPLPVCRIDPWVRFGSGGTLFVSCLGTKDYPVAAYRSADGGRTWDVPVRVPDEGRAADRPVLSAGAGESIYVAFGQSFAAPGLAGRTYAPAVSRSTDGGRTFAGPAFVHHDNLVQQPFDSEVLSSGVYVLFFMDFATSQEAPLAHRRTWAVRSADGGRTFSTPALVFEQAGQEMPWSVAADRSAAHRDRLYLAVDGSWRRRRREGEAAPAASGRSLFLLTSDDGGETWKAGGTVTGAPPGANAETPAVAVNRDGVVGVAWYDTRHDPRGECYDLFFTASLDGGATFLPEVRVTPEPSCPQASERQRGVASRWPFGGDYSGLAAGADGRFHLFWADSRAGIYQIRSASAQVISQLTSLGGSRYTAAR